MNYNSDFAQNLERVKKNIEAACNLAGRPRGSIEITAVSKVQPIENIRSILIAGHRIFGENRVQEAEKKWLLLKSEFPNAQLHLIGGLQTNKVSQAVKIFNVIETLDRQKLARSLADEFNKVGYSLNCFVQINSGEETHKSGIFPKHAGEFINVCRNEYQIPICGLMCIPPINDDPALHFALIAKIAERNGLVQLSMGMSNDYEVAVAFGATRVRIGTEIFGPRDQN